MIRNEAQSTQNNNKGGIQQAAYLKRPCGIPVMWLRADFGQEGELCPTVRAVRGHAETTLTN